MWSKKEATSRGQLLLSFVTKLQGIVHSTSLYIFIISQLLKKSNRNLSTVFDFGVKKREALSCFSLNGGICGHCGQPHGSAFFRKQLWSNCGQFDFNRFLNVPKPLIFLAFLKLRIKCARRDSNHNKKSKFCPDFSSKTLDFTGFFEVFVRYLRTEFLGVFWRFLVLFGEKNVVKIVVKITSLNKCPTS